jgi:hypothetical protein
MKRLLLLFVNFFVIVIIHAQTNPPTPFSINPYDSLITGKRFPPQKFKWNDSLSSKLREKLLSNETPPPGSLRKGFVYKGNNQNGFDVYQTLQDNMYILKPDSTFVSNMPILKFSLEQKPVMDENKN